MIIFAAVTTVVFISRCGKAPEPPAPPPASPAEVQKHMDDHFGKVREVQDAVIRGDLDEARTPAAWLAEHVATTGLPAGTESRVVDMKVAAKSVAAAQSVGNAAIATASLVRACGDCHTAAKVVPTFSDPPLQTSKEKVPSHMLEHQHAIELMYRGLVSPTSPKWMVGAQELKAAALVSKQLPEVPAEAVAAEARVHELADRAINAVDMNTRVTIYGALIGSCASCHALHGKVWGPGLSKSN
jgi:cytochrome c553